MLESKLENITNDEEIQRLSKKIHYLNEDADKKLFEYTEAIAWANEHWNTHNSEMIPILKNL